MVAEAKKKTVTKWEPQREGERKKRLNKYQIVWKRMLFMEWNKNNWKKKPNEAICIDNQIDVVDDDHWMKFNKYWLQIVASLLINARVRIHARRSWKLIKCENEFIVRETESKWKQK